MSILIPLFILSASIFLILYFVKKAKKDKDPYDDLIKDCIFNKNMTVNDTVIVVKKYVDDINKKQNLENLKKDRLNKLKHIFDGTNKSDNL